MRTHAAICAVVGILLTAQAGTLRCDPGKEMETERIARLVKQLGDDAFAKREDASRELDGIGEPALPALRKAAASGDDPEIRWRAGKLVSGIAGRVLAPLAKKELDALQGTWITTSTELGGVKGVDNVRTIFTADRWVSKQGEAVVQSGTLKVVAVSDKVVHIDFIVTGGIKNGDTWLAIYERNGDVLKWCGGWAGEDRARPATLTTKAGDGYFLRSLGREKE
jgi:uncharacterized protein (TIGR03067 family)